MTTLNSRCSTAALLTLVVAAAATPARAETLNCTPITSVPFTITVQGIYCLADNVATAITSGYAIEIQANNVVLDLNGFKLGGLGAGPGTGAYGIHADGRQNITVKNGTVRGFYRGIRLQNFGGGSQGHVVEGVRVDQNTYVGIEVSGDGIIVRNNQVVATGGTTNFGANASAFGIYGVGNGLRVLDNDVIDTVKQGTGTAWAIHLPGVFGGLVVNNRITAADVGIEYVTATSSTGKYRDNLTFDVPTGTRFIGGTDAGNNN